MLRFPIPAVALLPHEPPMLCIDSLLLASANDGTASVCLTPDHILLHNGVLSRAGYVELAVQTAEVAGVSLIDAAIYRDHATREPELLAAGTLKVFVPENGQIVL